MSEVMIGKYTIESLTTGMYTDPYVIFREYIQNAADAIDEAVEIGVLPAQAAYIKIFIDPVKKSISIEDNGVGLPEQTAYQTLSDIGNSKKTQGTNRGFRGIGRFSGLSYCDKLTFSTSSIQSTVAYSIVYDSKRLRSIITSDSKTISANDAMTRVISERHSKVSADYHFFRVTLENVHEDTKLLDVDKVYEYLRQIAPVPFDRNFSWSHSIVDTVNKYLGEIETYHIILETREKKIDVTKPYCDTFLLNRQTGATDHVTGISYFPIKDVNHQTIGAAWYGKSNYQGTIIGNEIKGLRVRVGNILVGDHTSLNHIFKDPRFNGWIIGEVYIKDPSLIPNARRDDFERNDAYYLVVEQLRKLANDIVKEIRATSAERNKALSKAVDEVETISAKADEVLDSDRISPAKKGQITAKILKAREHLNAWEFSGLDEESRQDAIEKLDLLTGRIQGAASFKALNLIPELTKNDKSLLEKVFIRLLDHYSESDAEHCIDMILSVFRTSENDD